MSEPAPGATAIRVLLVDDEVPIRRFLRSALEPRGYAVADASTLAEARMQCTARPPDLVLLDLGLPDGDGIALVEEIRGWSKLPIVVLSARGQEADKVRALDAGADDYLTKPFGTGELLARMRVALRNAARAAGGEGEPVFTVGELKVDLGARRVFVGDEEVHLTRTEYNLLALLVKHAGKVLTHRQLLKEVWGPGSTGESHYLRVYMGQLRHKLERDPARPRYLLTETGVGYRLKAD